MLGQKALSLEKAAIVVLDEADRMLDMGFEEAINSIFEQLPQPYVMSSHACLRYSMPHFGHVCPRLVLKWCVFVLLCSGCGDACGELAASCC